MKMFFAGVVTVWAVNFVVLWMYDNNKIKDESVMGTLVTGIWGIIFWAVVTIWKKAHSSWKNRNFKALMVDPDGELCYCNSSKEPEWLMEYDDYKFASGLDSKYTIVDGWRKDDCFMNMVNIRYTPKHILEKEQAYQVDKEIIRKAKENYAQFE